MSSLYIHNLLSRNVRQQTGKGKISRQQVITVVGNQNGLVGVGIGKSDGFPEAFAMATRSALRNMDYVERFEDRTVWTEMEHKFGATRVIMRPRPVGFGLRCNPNIYHILKAAGIKDVSAKVWGSRNPMQVAHTVMQMLLPGCEPLGMGMRVGMRTKDEIERERGRKLVPLRYP
ncbi:ribosomal protein S5 domain 2-type protein [Fomitopsis serialis]|uniref:ribosomal protein S5 domain 2-type protein n=1 Tax=Fomitopsis serialis TaxID=139415 RepID=UPI0020089F4E|nr:ribosomal protein S5 domain 2-type protein [Neoantrodia serialis]KAH9917172.1 ribosomal protein S5 domain 2-type protein [Neoantrodia serialis]